MDFHPIFSHVVSVNNTGAVNSKLSLSTQIYELAPGKC